MGVTVRQKALPAGKYDAGDYSVERLQAYAANTNAAIAKGFSVPVIDRHADLEALAEDSALRTLGQVKQVFVQDGALGYEFDLVDGEAEKRLKVLKTSPEFREKRAYNGFGELGPHVRHVALTAKPRNQFQGPFEIVGDGVARFYEGDDMADEEKPDDETKPDFGGEGDEAKPAEDVAPVNPDMPKDDKAGQVMEAIVAQMETLGICVPADWSFESEGAADILLAALKTFQAAKAAAEPKPEEEPEAPKVEESPSPVAFSEEELKAMDPKVAAVLRRAAELEAKEVQFAEEKATHKKAETLSLVESKLANVPALKDKLVARLTTVAFSESGEQPTLTVKEAAEMFAAALPPNLQFSEAGVTVADHEAGEKFFERKPGEITDEEAEKLVNQMFTRGK